jgi:hypothetical protein
VEKLVAATLAKFDINMIEQFEKIYLIGFTILNLVAASFKNCLLDKTSGRNCILSAEN